MRRTRLGPILAAAIAAGLFSGDLAAARRTVVKERTAVVVSAGFPLHRPLPRAVLVRPTRRAIVFAAPVFFLAPVTFAAVTTPLPPRDRLVWEDTERIARSEDWVDLQFGVDSRGDAVLLELQGRAQLSFAEVTFSNGHVQVVDFRDRLYGRGLYTLLDFAGGRHVKTVRLLARSRSPDTTFRILIRK